VVTFHPTKYKELIEYSLFTVKVVDEDKKCTSFKSLVSTDKPFTLKKNGKYIEGVSKNKSSFVYMIVLSTEKDDMAKNEIEMLPILEKRIRLKIPFRFLYKKKLRDRLKRIINSSCP